MGKPRCIGATLHPSNRIWVWRPQRIWSCLRGQFSSQGQIFADSRHTPGPVGRDGRPSPPSRLSSWGKQPRALGGQVGWDAKADRSSCRGPHPDDQGQRRGGGAAAEGWRSLGVGSGTGETWTTAVSRTASAPGPLAHTLAGLTLPAPTWVLSAHGSCGRALGSPSHLDRRWDHRGD